LFQGRKRSLALFGGGDWFSWDWKRDGEGIRILWGGARILLCKSHRLGLLLSLPMRDL